MGRMDGSTPPAGRGRTGRGVVLLAAAVLALLGGGVWIAAALREATDTHSAAGSTPPGTPTERGDPDPNGTLAARPAARADISGATTSTDTEVVPGARAADPDPAEPKESVQVPEEPDEGQAASGDALPTSAPLARIGTPARWRDDEPIYAVAFTPDARRVVSAGESSVIVVREVDGGRVLAQLVGAGAGGVSDVEVSPDGHRVLSGGYDHTVRLWDLESHEVLRSLEPGNGTIYHVGFTPDGRRAVIAGSLGDVVLLWDLETGAVVRRFDMPGMGNSACITRDGRALAAADSGGKLWVWDLASGRVILEKSAHEGACGEVYGVPGSDDLMTCGEDGMVRRWSLPEGALVREWKAHDARISEMALSPDGSTVATGGWEGRVKHWRVADGALLWEREGHTEMVVAVAFSRDGRFVASGARDGSTTLWDATTGDPVGAEPLEMEGHSGAVTALAFAGSSLVSAGEDRTLRTWDVDTRTWRRLFRVDGPAATSIAWDATEGRLVAGGGSQVRRIDLHEGREIWRHDLGEAVCGSVAPGPDGRTVLALVRGESLRILDASTGVGQGRVDGEFEGLAVSAADRATALLRLPRTLELLSSTGAPLRTVSLVSPARAGRVTWFPDGGSLLVPCEEGAMRVRAGDGTTIATYRTHDDAPGGDVTPDGRRVVLATEGGEVVSFDAWSGEPRQRFAAHKGPVRCVAISPDGKTVASGGSEGAIYLWELRD
jgi:WD40 repeat protein